MTLHEISSRFLSTRLMFILTFLLLTFSGCEGKDNDPPDDPPKPTDTIVAQAYLTRGDQVKLFNKEGDIPIKPAANASWPVITIDTTITYQTIEGYGAALTGSSAYLMNRKMSSGARGTLLRELFDPNTGIGISYLRLTMGASDFSLSNFSYDDIPTSENDFELQHFSFSQDTLDVIPVAKEIAEVFPEMTFMGSPWSAPAWMKTSKSMVGGSLRTDCYGTYAAYFVKYIQGMGQKGIKIDAITPQNEPLYYTASYPCMDMSSAAQLNFIKDHLGPKFVEAGLDTKIILYDHNWDHPEYPINILNDPDAKQYVAGSAFHAYGGQVSAMSTVHNAHPDKGLYFTEISGGRWATDFSENLMWNMQNIFMGTARNWSKNALLWNLALDENDGPQNNGCGDCRGVVTINSGSGVVTRNVEYYALAHFAKFIRPGAVRVMAKLGNGLGNFDAVSFRNTDGTKVLVALNSNTDAKVFTVKHDKKNMSYTLPAKSVVTIVWK